MIVTEAHRTRSLVIRLDRGEELPTALIRALDEVEARAAWITGAGAVEAAEVALYDQLSRDFDRSRKIDTPCGIVSLNGSAALTDGALSLRLSTTLARETDLGLQLLAGQLLWARVLSVELHVVAFDDVTLLRAPDERTGLPVLVARKAAVSSLAEPRATPAPEPQRATPTPEPQRALPVQPRTAEPPVAQQYPPPTAVMETPALPQKPTRHHDDVDAYPEVGDAVTHFHFGECTVIGSDGDRIRLRQDRDGRVREVALAMLRIEAPTIVNGQRQFKLARKN